MQHSNLPPVLDTYVVDGNEINIRYRDAWGNLCRNYVRRLPQNVAAKQGINHAILGTCAEDTGRRLPAVAAGRVGGVGDGVRGSEAE